jgi:copper chaperone NosL
MKTQIPSKTFTRFPKVVLILGLMLVLLAGCQVKPEPIAYGSDACHFCRMTIVDQQHGAEMVTRKGKVFKFDAVECLLNHLKEVDDQTVALYLVNTYTQPGELKDATGAAYLVSEAIPSPMGDFLTAFEKEMDALDAVEKHGGDVYSWAEIRNRFNQ